MLKALFGSKTVGEILLFLLVNEECYAHQLQRILKISLTPTQKALNRLERGGILKSSFRGKLRIYTFDSQSSLLSSLLMLLKETYHALSLQEKKRYYYLPYHKDDKKLLKTIWKHMTSVTQMTLIAESKGSPVRKGKGEVSVEQQGSSLIFQEQGVWSENLGRYQNRFRWTWNREKGLLSLEHLRHGDTRPAFLFDLCSKGKNSLQSLSPHLCGQDTYFGWMEYRSLVLYLHIRTLGPKKDEKLEYAYL